MSYAARHPDLFGAALAFSGAPDIALRPRRAPAATPVINATEVGLDHVPPNSIFGHASTEEINWAAHDPTTLAPEPSRDEALDVHRQRPGRPARPLAPSLSSTIEAGVQVADQAVPRPVGSLGIPSCFDDYGPGTHAWPYWTRDLRESIGPIMAAFAHPPRAPRQVTYTSADPSYSVFGWRVSLHRHVAEFSTLTRAGIRGFELMGSGSATVTTPARYAARRLVSGNGPVAFRRALRVAAGAAQRSVTDQRAARSVQHRPAVRARRAPPPCSKRACRLPGTADGSPRPPLLRGSGAGQV